MNFSYVPNDIRIDPLVLMPQLVADGFDIAPWYKRIIGLHVLRNMTGGFGNDLHGPLNREAQNWISLKVSEILARNGCLNDSNVVKDVMKSWSDGARGHYRTLIADCSIAFDNIG